MSFSNAFLAGKNVPYSDYKSDIKRGDPRYPMSRGELCKFLDCPSKWLDGGGHDEEKNESMEWGSLIDTLVLQPEKFDKQYAVCPETYPAAKGESRPWTRQANYCREWEAERESEGLKCIKRHERDEALRATDRLYEDGEIVSIMIGSATQVMCTAQWDDKETGISVPVRILVDIVPYRDPYDKTLIDLKTVKTARLAEWSRQVFKYNWHVQAAMYLDVYTAATCEDRCEFRHIVQENSPPYVTAKRIVSEELLELGRDTYKSALELYCLCLKSGVWPDYDSGHREQINGWTRAEIEPWMISASKDWPTFLCRKTKHT